MAPYSTIKPCNLNLFYTHGEFNNDVTNLITVLISNLHCLLINDTFSQNSPVEFETRKRNYDIIGERTQESGLMTGNRSDMRSTSFEVNRNTLPSWKIQRKYSLSDYLFAADFVEAWLGEERRVSVRMT